MALVLLTADIGPVRGKNPWTDSRVSGRYPKNLTLLPGKLIMFECDAPVLLLAAFVDNLYCLKNLGRSFTLRTSVDARTLETC